MGPDITHNFLKEHKLKLLVRSHQCKEIGYDKCHDKKCFTIFSASNYYDKDSNKGAVLKFDSILQNATVMTKRQIQRSSSTVSSVSSISSFTSIASNVSISSELTNKSSNSVNLNGNLKNKNGHDNINSDITSAKKTDKKKDKEYSKKKQMTESEIEKAKAKALEARNKMIKDIENLKMQDHEKIVNYTKPKVIGFQVDLAKITNKGQSDLVENRHTHAIMSLRYKILGNMAKVHNKLKMFEMTNGLVKLEDWSKIMKDQLHIELPWMLIRNELPLETYMQNIF